MRRAAAILILLMIAGCGRVVETPASNSTVYSTITFSDSTGTITFNDFTGTKEAMVIIACQNNDLLSANLDFSYLANYISGGASPNRSFSAPPPAAEPGENLPAFLHQKELELLEQHGPPQHDQNQVAAMAVTVGATEEFYALQYNSDEAAWEYAIVTAEVAAVGEHCYLYVEQDRIAISAESIAEFVAEFDDNAYPKVRAYFGSEPNPGIDNDAKMTLLFYYLHHTLGDGIISGYFLAGNEYPRSTNAYSNEREMVYFNGETANLRNVKCTLVHELQHLVNFNNKTIINGTAEALWLNEGLSTYAEHVAGHGLPGAEYNMVYKVNSYLSSPEGNCLISMDYNLSDYGTVYLFTLYLAEQYGADAIRSLVTSSRAGVDNVENATGATMTEIFNKWVAANYLDGLIAETTANAGYFYPSIDLRATYNTDRGVDLILSGATYEAVGAYPNALASKNLRVWAPSYILFSPPDDTSQLTVTISGEAGSAISGQTIYGYF
ncbi:peptidase MA family metallohydrolase [Candidatus Margulisiibacteriota bacterium]